MARKIVMFPLVRVVVGFAMLFGGLALAQAVSGFIASAIGATDMFEQLISTIFTVLFGLAGYILFVRFVELREVTELEGKGATIELGQGVLVGFLLMSAVICVLWLFGFYSASGIGSYRAMGVHFFAAIVAGVIEELAFRGLVFRIIEEYMGSWWALAVSALIFGFLHAGNPNATLFSSVAIALEAGILLGAVFMLTRRLWLAIGVHFAWNFTQGGLYGVAVSGNDWGGLLDSQLQGAELLSGGAFGAEASIFAVVICTLLGLYYVRQSILAGHMVAPIWVRERETAVSPKSIVD